MNKILSGLSKISQNIKIIFPVHPRIKSLIRDNKSSLRNENIMFVKPQSYLDFTRLLAGCDFVITDSGGVQKEAFFHQRPCITVREETEWVETVNLGANSLVNACAEDIFNAWEKKTCVGFSDNPYGQGNASEKFWNIFQLIYDL